MVGMLGSGPEAALVNPSSLLCPGAVCCLRDWRIEHIVRQERRGVDSAQLCDGTLVKLGQGLERHLNGGKATEWLGYFLLWASFIAGAAVGGCISLVVSGSQMLTVAACVCALTSG